MKFHKLCESVIKNCLMEALILIHHNLIDACYLCILLLDLLLRFWNFFTKDISSISFPKGTTSKLAGFFFPPSFSCRTPSDREILSLMSSWALHCCGLAKSTLMQHLLRGCRLVGKCIAPLPVVGYWHL